MDVTVEVKVSQVTVFPDRAQVVARGEATLETGAHRLLVENLPVTLDTDSMRAGGEGTAVLRLLSVDVSPQHYRDAPVEKVRALEAEIEQVENQIRALEDEKAVWQAHGRFLDGMRQATAEYAKGLSRGRTTVADQANIVAFLQAEDRDLRTAVRDLDVQLHDQNRTLDKLRRELKALQSVRPRQRYRAAIDVDVQTAGQFSLELSYVVGRAGWRPLYDIRLNLQDTNNPEIEITTIAQITQQSEQDWENVQLAVSTARPALNQRLPDIRPWYIDVLPPRPEPRLAKVTAVPDAAPAAMPAAMPAAVRMAEAEVTEAAVAVADAVDSGTAVRFVVSGRSDVPSDGSPHKTTLSHARLTPRLDYFAAPKHTDAIFRRAVVANDSGAPLLSGAANLFVDDDFIGRTQLEYTPAGDEIELLLGVEERITVLRELVRRDVDKRLLRDRRLTRYGYKIELKNLLETAVDLEIHDHAPVARHEQISVKLDKIEPAPAERSDLNVLEWRLRLDPGAEQTIRYEFQVEHPQAMHVVGLP